MIETLTPESDPAAFDVLSRCYVRFCDAKARRGRGSVRTPRAENAFTTLSESGEHLAAARRLEALGLAEVSPWEMRRGRHSWWVCLTEQGLEQFHERWEWDFGACRWVARSASPGEA